MIGFIRSEGLTFEETHLGNSPSFKYAINKVIAAYDDNDIVYMLEDDYLHRQGSMQAITEGLEIADYVTLYDHPDQYMTYTFRNIGAAPLNRFGLHRWRIFVTEHSHWRETPSTTMTFAARVKTLKEDCKIFMRNPDIGAPKDFLTFLKLTKRRNPIDAVKVLNIPGLALTMLIKYRSIAGALRGITMPGAFLTILLNNLAWFRKKRLLVSSVPGLSTHCEPKLLSPLTDWTKI